MASITQTIPTYALGISQQSDEAKLPGQVKDALNVVPDITDSLYKRPGTKYINTLSGTLNNGKWFNYFRDEDEGSYIGYVDRNGTVRAWRAEDGVEMTIVSQSSPSTYLAHTADSDIGTCTINDTTFICNSDITNSQTEVKMVNQVLPGTDVAPSKPDANSCYVELKQVAPRRQYALNIYDNDTETTEFTATSVKVISGISNNSDGDESCPYTGSQVHVDSTTGIAVRVTCIGQPYVSGYDNSPPNAQYSCQYTLRVDLLYGGSYTTSRVNTNVFSVSIEGITHAIQVTGETSGSFRGNIQRIRPVPTDIEQETAISVTGVLNSIKAQITNQNLAVRIVGNGLYITKPANTDFNVEALEGDLFNIVKDEINSVANLPTCCIHGYIVKVVNSEDTVNDDYYLKFVGRNNKDGEGHWEECPEPGVSLSIDRTRMPYVLQRTGALTMTLAPYTWTAREVGDENTNKKPSFVNNRINQVLFHRNRLVMLSGSNIILSQPEDLGSFWNKTALTFSGTDRIDISCSSSSPNSLVDGIEMNTGLVLFSSNAQFLFATDSDLLNPETAKVYSLSNYSYNPNNTPFSLGLSIGFVDTQGLYSRFYEMNDVRRESEPQIIDQSKSVPRLMPALVDMVSNSRENSHIFFSKKGTKTVFGFKYFNAGEKRLQGAWFRWEFPRPLLHHYVVGNRYYTVSSEGVLSFLPLNDSASTLIIGDASESVGQGESFTVHLDNYDVISNHSYNSSTDTTTFTIPSIYTSGKCAAIVIDFSSNSGRYQVISGVPGSTGTLKGDWTGANFVIGDQYSMSVEFPTIYPTSTKNQRVVSDTHCSLTLHRLILNFGDVGQFTTTLTREGKSTFSETHQSSILDAYKANRAPYLEESFRTIPVYERNSNVSLTLSSEHPSPLQLQSMSWEGDYTNNYYRRI